MSYFSKLFLLLVLTWAAVGLERMVMAFVLPGVQKEFGLNYAQAGAAIAVFGFAWALGTFVMGGLSDRVGRKPVIVLLVIFGGICSWITGLAPTFATLLVIRAIMGFADGGIWGPASATLAEESSPMTRARNVGLMSGFFTLAGGSLAPVLSTQLTAHYGWRFVFYVYAIPAVILGILVWRMMKEPASTQATLRARREGQSSQKRRDAGEKGTGYWDVWKHRNIILLMLVWTFDMANLWLFTSFGMLLLVKVHRLPITTVGLIMAGTGIGVFLGAPIFGVISDHVGRRKTLIFCQTLGGVAGMVFASFNPGASLPVLFAVLLARSFFASGTTPILVSVSVETVGFALAATAIGAVTGVGELIGGGILPVIGGGIADRIGLSSTLYLAGALLIIGAICGFFLRETAPRLVSKGEGAQVRSQQ